MNEYTDPIPQFKRLSESQIQNTSGGYVYEVTDFQRLDRFLCLGTEIGYYKANSHYRTFSRSDVLAIDRLIQKGQGHYVVRCIKNISVQGRAFRQNPALYALAVCARSNDLSTKHAAYSVLNDVCRIPTHLFQFIHYCEEMSGHETGWGRAHRNAISQWYTHFGEIDPYERYNFNPLNLADLGTGTGWDKAHRKAISLWYHSLSKIDPHEHNNPLKLAHLVTKYRQRFKWKHKDVIRLAHVRSKNKAIRIILQYALGKKIEVADSRVSAVVGKFLVAVQKAKRCSIKIEGDEDRLCEYISVYGLSLEHVPNQFLNNSIKVWDVLFRAMSMATLIENLGKMTSLIDMSKDNEGVEMLLRLAERKLDDDLNLARACIHPLTLLIAIKNYERGTRINKKISWTPNPRITKALTNAFIRSTRVIQPKGKKYLMAISVGENMRNRICDSAISAVEAASAMVYSTIQTEDVEVILFSSRIEKAFTTSIEKDDTLQSIVQKICQMTPATGSQQDLSVPFMWSAKREKKFDAIMVFTDSITSCGNVHPVEALKKYTEYMTIPDYRFVVVAMTSNKYSIAAPDSVHNLDVVGFDTKTPGLIMEFMENSQRRFMDEDMCVDSDDDLYT